MAGPTSSRTAAALQSRRTAAAAMVERVHDALRHMKREQMDITAAAVARRALLTELRGGSPHVNGVVVVSGATVCARDRRK